MASEQTVLNVMGKVLFDPRPTVTDLRARQLAAALGYPVSWRVVRTLEKSIRERKGGEEEEVACIVDRIHAGKPGTGCDMWYHHEAAMRAAEEWVEGKSTPFDHKGGHLLPPQPLYAKGEKVQAFYEGEWWDAKILKSRHHRNKFLYQVHYTSDSAKQSGVEEGLIRPRPAVTDPSKTAEELGFGEGWKAFCTGNNRWKVVSPTGETYTSKKVALAAYRQANQQKQVESAMSEGDPPWRTTGSDYLGKRVLFTSKHSVSARRTVTVEQIGQVTGWISETDVDAAGEPGFVSDYTGQPAALYHVVFDDDPNNPYPSHMVQFQDMEEFELIECLIPEEGDQPAKKKARKN